jgi:hypothetical protein
MSLAAPFAPPRLLKLALAALGTCAACGSASAQPDPTFRSSCEDLRAALNRHPLDDETLATIQVVGALTGVDSDGTLAYLSLCRAPNPQVLCVTYSTNDRKPGEQVVVSGAFSRRGPDHILLDPCLHFPLE